MISAPGIEARSDGGSARHVIDAAHRGEAGAMGVIAETGRMLGVAIASHAVIVPGHRRDRRGHFRGG